MRTRIPKDALPPVKCSPRRWTKYIARNTTPPK